MKTIETIYRELLDTISQLIPYDPSWKGKMYRHTGAITHPENALRLPSGTCAKSVDEYGRRVVFMGTAAGLMVIYPRYVNGSMKHISFDADCNVHDESGKVHPMLLASILACRQHALKGNRLTA